MTPEETLKTATTKSWHNGPYSIREVALLIGRSVVDTIFLVNDAKNRTAPPDCPNMGSVRIEVIGGVLFVNIS